MGYLLFFIFISLLASVPEFLNSLFDSTIGNISVVGTFIFLGIIFLYSLRKGYRHKISYVIVSVFYWLSTLSITFYTFVSDNKFLFHTLSLLNFAPMSAFVSEGDVFYSTLVVFIALVVTIGVGFTSGYFLKNYVTFNKKQKATNENLVA